MSSYNILAVFMLKGLKDGQTKMVRFGNKVELYTWDTVHHRWNKTGDVVGASEADHQSTGKTTYEGKVFICHMQHLFLCRFRVNLLYVSLEFDNY